MRVILTNKNDPKEGLVIIEATDVRYNSEDKELVMYMADSDCWCIAGMSQLEASAVVAELYLNGKADLTKHFAVYDDNDMDDDI